MVRSVLALLVAAATLPVSMPVTASASNATESCFYDETRAVFDAQPAGVDGQAARAGTISNSEHLKGTLTVIVDGLRYEKIEDSMETSAVVNEFVIHDGMVMDVRLFRPRGDRYSEYIFLPDDPRNCSWATFQYMPEVHFAWLEDQSEFVDGFLFKHPALAVDPASFRKQGEYMRGIGFDVFGHPHKQDDGSQPRYNRTYIEADCAGKRLRVLDQRSFAANWELTGITGGAEQWFTAEDVYPALAMLMHAMCDVPRSAWSEDTRLPGTLDEFSDYVHAAAHGKVK